MVDSFLDSLDSKSFAILVSRVTQPLKVHVHTALYFSGQFLS